MHNLFTPAGSRRGALCAVVLLAAILLSLLHATVSHCPASSECVACRTLHAPALAHAPSALSRPASPTSPAVEPAERLLVDRSPLLKPLRAPPSPATI